jgi:arginase
MGRGPVCLLESGLAESLRAERHDVEIVSLRLPETLHAEGEALVELQKLTVATVGDALERNRRPLILSGNCGPAALSAVSALGAANTGVIWFDAHADFNTPETSASGFLDGMALAILTGRCWPSLAARFAGFEPLPETNVILVGARDLDPKEAHALNHSAITRLAPAQIGLLDEAVEALSQRVEDFYVHLDVDVLDESEGRANSYASSGGLSADNLYTALKLLHRSGRIRVAGITSYDPVCDPEGRVGAIVGNAAKVLAGSLNQ